MLGDSFMLSSRSGKTDLRDKGSLWEGQGMSLLWLEGVFRALCSALRFHLPSVREKETSSPQCPAVLVGQGPTQVIGKWIPGPREELTL
jgi:hypothetical protein